MSEEGVELLINFDRIDSVDSVEYESWMFGSLFFHY